MIGLLREQAFRRFWTGQTISLVGDQVSLLALPLAAVLVLHAGPREMGYLTAAALAPNLVFALHIGALVDRRGRRRQTMIAADLGRALLTASIPIAYAFDALTLTQLYVVAFLLGTLSVLFTVCVDTLFVALVPRERYVEANSLFHASRALSFVAGPSLGGLLVQALSAPVTIVVDAVSYVCSALFLRSIRPEEPARGEEERGILAGVRFLVRTPAMRAGLASTATINLFNFMFFALFVLYATRMLHVRPGTLGLVLGAGALGGVAGALLTRRIAARIGVGPAFVAGSLLFPAPLLLVPAASGSRPVILGCLFLAELGSGFGVVLLDICGASIFQALVPDHLRARVSGAFQTVNYGVRPVGALLGGFLGERIGLRPTLWIATGGALAGILFLIPSPLPRMRELPPGEQPAAGL
jgi:MFS family permease